MEKILGKFSPREGIRVFLFSSLVLFLFFCTYQHQPWRDEYQTFLASTRPPTFGEFWTAVRYERTPPLHYLILRYLWPIFDGWLDPRNFIRMVTLPFSVLTLWLITFRFRFSLVSVLLLGLNIFFFREWGVLSRSYALGGAFLVLSLVYRSRGKSTAARFFVLAAACTHLLFLVSCGVVLFIEYFSILRLEGGRFFRRWEFWCISFVSGIMLIQQIPPPDSSFQTQVSWPGVARLLSDSVRFFAVIFFPLEHDLKGMWDGSWSWNAASISAGYGISAFIFLGFLFGKNRNILLKFLMTAAPILFIYNCGYAPALRHYAVLFIFFLYYWIQHRETLLENRLSSPGRVTVLDSLAFLGPAIASIYWLVLWNPFEPAFDFSDSPRLAALLAKAPQTFTTHDYLLFSAMAESGRPVYDLSNGRWAYYPVFRKGFSPVSISNICLGRVPGVVLGNSDILAVHPSEVGLINNLVKQCPGWTPIYETDRRIATDESFTVFEYIKPVMTAKIRETE